MASVDVGGAALARGDRRRLPAPGAQGGAPSPGGRSRPGHGAAAAGACRRRRTAEWAVLERVALRGMSVTEAADALGIERREALRLLHRGMLAAGGCLSGERQAGDDAQAVGLDVLGVDLAAGGLDDPARDRQPEPAAVLERRR